MSTFKSAFLCIFLICSSVSSSQTIRGVVKDVQTKDVLQDVHIVSSGIKSGTISDELGKFTVDLKKGFSSGDSISFSSVGYRTVIFTFYELQQLEGNVQLVPVIDELKEVNLNTEIVLNKELQFSRIASLKKGVYSFGSTIVGDEIYVIAGDASRLEEPIKKEMATRLGDPSISEILRSANTDFSFPKFLEDIQVYDLTKDEWKILPVTVDRRAGHNVVFHKNRIYIFGGKKLLTSGKKVLLTNTVDILDLQRDTVLVDQVYPHQASGAASVSYNGDLLVMGGSIRINKRRKKEFTNKVHLFNFETGLWFDAGKMNTAKESNAALVGDKMYIIGGNNGNWLNTIESLDLLTGKWKIEAKMSTTWNDPAVVSHGGIIYIYEKGKIFTFDIGKNEVKSYRVDLDVQGPDLHVWNGYLFIIGGYNEHLYTKKPIAGCFKIDLNQFDKTEILERFTF